MLNPEDEKYKQDVVCWLSNLVTTGGFYVLRKKIQLF